MKIDLHLHSTCSDGTDLPEALVEKAVRLGFHAIALTDHDTVAGVDSAMRAGAVLNLTVIPGVEISAGGEDEVHVLGYGMRKLDEMEISLAQMRESRNLRMEKMVHKLETLGISVPLEAFARTGDGSVGRAHLAVALVEKGAARDVRDAFARYLSPGCPAYVPREKLTVAGAIALIRASGGTAAIAHPALRRDADRFLETRLRAFVEEGLQGLEVYHPSHTALQVREMLRIARGLNLLVTGGSDYHGTIKQVSMGDGTEGWQEMQGDYQRLIDRIRGWGTP